jgi:hypothetical protein
LYTLEGRVKNGIEDVLVNLRSCFREIILAIHERTGQIEVFQTWRCAR